MLELSVRKVENLSVRKDDQSVPLALQQKPECEKGAPGGDEDQPRTRQHHFLQQPPESHKFKNLLEPNEYQRNLLAENKSLRNPLATIITSSLRRTGNNATVSVSIPCLCWSSGKKEREVVLFPVICWHCIRSFKTLVISEYSIFYQQVLWSSFYTEKFFGLPVSPPSFIKWRNVKLQVNLQLMGCMYGNQWNGGEVLGKTHHHVRGPKSGEMKVSGAHNDFFSLFPSCQPFLISRHCLSR